MRPSRRLRIPRRLLFTVAILIAAGLASRILERATDAPVTTSSAEIERLFEQRRSDVMVEVAGRVDRVLDDDLRGSRHQRFIVRLDSGRTLLVAHNIDLAERVPLETGDEIELRGEYEWNQRGGVVHWTHHDPQGRRAGGWVRHRGRTYR